MNGARVKRYAAFVRWCVEQGVHFLPPQDDFAWMLFSAMDDEPNLISFLRGRATGSSFAFEKIIEYLRDEKEERERFLVEPHNSTNV